MGFYHIACKAHVPITPVGLDFSRRTVVIRTPLQPSGDITTEFPVQVTRKGRDGLVGTIGNGEGRIAIDTASGDVTLKQLP